MCTYAQYTKVMTYAHTFYRLLLDHGASTTLPDSTGRPLKSDAFHGIQVLIETQRKERMREITNALVHRTPLKEFEKIWHVCGLMCVLLF